MSRRNSPTINASGMADIAFLLLIFFLVATTFLKEKGVKATLPPYYDGPAGAMPDNYVLDIKVNKHDEVMVEDEITTIEQLPAILKEFVINPNKRSDYTPSPDKAVISLQNDEQTSYKAYLQVYSIIRLAYKEMRNDLAQKLYQTDYLELSIKHKNSIIQALPIKISEADPYIAKT